MEETPVGIAASAAVASLADWVDLDGSLLLADDPFAASTSVTTTWYRAALETASRQRL